MTPRTIRPMATFLTRDYSLAMPLTHAVECAGFDTEYELSTRNFLENLRCASPARQGGLLVLDAEIPSDLLSNVIMPGIGPSDDMFSPDFYTQCREAVPFLPIILVTTDIGTFRACTRTDPTLHQPRNAAFADPLLLPILRDRNVLIDPEKFRFHATVMSSLARGLRSRAAPQPTGQAA